MPGASLATSRTPWRTGGRRITAHCNAPAGRNNTQCSGPKQLLRRSWSWAAELQPPRALPAVDVGDFGHRRRGDPAAQSRGRVGRGRVGGVVLRVVAAGGRAVPELRGADAVRGEARGGADSR